MTKARRLLLPALIIAIAISFTPILNFAGLGVDQAYAAAKVKAPKNVKVKVVSQTALKISWGKVKGAKGYTVYQKKGSKFKAIKTLKGKSTTVKNLKAGTKYTFYVKAFKKKGKKKIYSKASKKVSAKTKAAVTPAPQPAVTEPTAVCKNGKFVGTEEASGVVSFKGIPYAKPPVGARGAHRRFPVRRGSVCLLRDRRVSCHIGTSAPCGVGTDFLYRDDLSGNSGLRLARLPEQRRPMERARDPGSRQYHHRHLQLCRFHGALHEPL